MSGGSYDYLCDKDAADLMLYEGRLEEMANRLASMGGAEDVAKDAFDLLAVVRGQRVRIVAAMDRLRGVFKAVEWVDSADWSADAIKWALLDYRGERKLCDAFAPRDGVTAYNDLSRCKNCGFSLREHPNDLTVPGADGLIWVPVKA